MLVHSLVLTHELHLPSAIDHMEKGKFHQHHHRRPRNGTTMVTCLLNYINAKHATGVFKTVKEWQTMVIDNFRVMLIAET